MQIVYIQSNQVNYKGVTEKPLNKGYNLPIHLTKAKKSRSTTVKINIKKKKENRGSEREKKGFL